VLFQNTLVKNLGYTNPTYLNPDTDPYPYNILPNLQVPYFFYGGDCSASGCGSCSSTTR